MISRCIYIRSVLVLPNIMMSLLWWWLMLVSCLAILRIQHQLLRFDLALLVICPSVLKSRRVRITRKHPVRGAIITVVAYWSRLFQGRILPHATAICSPQPQHQPSPTASPMNHWLRCISQTTATLQRSSIDTFLCLRNFLSSLTTSNALHTAHARVAPSAIRLQESRLHMQRPDL